MIPHPITRCPKRLLSPTPCLMIPPQITWRPGKARSIRQARIPRSALALNLATVRVHARRICVVHS
ncbi:hypothetical protein BDA96_04G121000 [Sorghum bicolor]|uniref:Uncharacterized protein n=1 Tax=Sorghum bicolor TaxID=4558 RepID=A0A921R2C1_SORBI|nr:hypothetical protein BDA96_04G121000 [Sorghum bicolor]